MSVKRPDPVDVEVGHRIRIERLSRGLSQTALANQLGVTFQQVQKYEKGVNRVGAGRLTKIAEVLGVSVSTFFSGKEVLESEKSLKEGHAESPLKLLTVSGAFRLLRAYADIEDSNLRRSIVDLVEKGHGWTVMPINSLRRGERPGLSWQRIIKPAIEVTVCLVRPVRSSQPALPTEAAVLARNTLEKMLSEPSGG